MILGRTSTTYRWRVWAACAYLLVAATSAMEGGPMSVAVVPFEESAAPEVGAALAALVAGVVRARGGAARSVPPPAECGVPDGPACARALLAALARGALVAGVMPAARVPPAPRLRDAGLVALGEVAPGTRRACLATAGPARSLLDLAEPATAAVYHITPELLAHIAHNTTVSYYCYNKSESPAEACSSGDTKYATIVTGDKGEASILVELIHDNGLLAEVAVVEARAERMVTALATRPGVVCGRAPPAPAARLLGPPPCRRHTCPFDTRSLIKLINVRELATSPGIIQSLGRLALDEDDITLLRNSALSNGPETAAQVVLARHPAWISASGEVRVAVMIPVTTRREVHDAIGFRVAAELAEIDVAAELSLNRSRPRVEFKVELIDDGCAATKAFKYLIDSLGSEFGALSGVAGPACGGAFGDVMRQSPAFSLPVLAYTAQARPPGDASHLALLAAGDAARATPAWAALFKQYNWRRVTVLTELATRATFDQIHLGVDILYHKELPDDSDNYDEKQVFEWVEHTARLNGRILFLCVEDARVARAALCAGLSAGLAPTDGAVWLLTGSLPDGWMQPSPDDTHNCTHSQIQTMADGHITIKAEWATTWESSAPAPDAAEWASRWAARRAVTHSRPVVVRPGQSVVRPAPHAALLYDLLRLWAAALMRLLTRNPAALDDLHREDLVSSLIEDAVHTPYVGITGRFEWSDLARSSALIVQQWRNESYVSVGSWRDGALRLEQMVWRTADGGAPGDGGERCALRPLADALRVECRVAYAALVALVLAAALAALAATAWHCRRRAEREFRARLVALDMRAIATKPGSLDRWEVPRERVVINRKLGTGAFGTVYGGHALLAEDRGWSAVAVKTLKAGATTEEKLDFLSEAEAMKRFDHKNVVKLLGVVTKTEPVCTVMEFMLYGDLKNYLVARRHLAGCGGMAGGEVSPARLTGMALDVARALSYLAQLRYVHRDVAARNCLVSANRVVKLADFGMTRLVFENDYYRFSRKGMLPVRWMAPESLALGVFSPASDVWSFGVLLYEIVTFGSLPFQGLSNAEVLARVKAGQTLELPSGLKPQLEGLIKSCWQRERRARPGAAAVAAFLAESPRLLAPCLDAPLDALPLEGAGEAGGEGSARWLSWAAPTSAATDSTYLSAEGAPRDTDAFLPPDPPP